MSADLVALIKKAAMDAVRASKPTAIVYGEVKAVNPLKVQVDQRLTLEEDFLVLTKAVTSYTAIGTTSTDSGHSHTVTVTIDNSLQVGDKVTMIMVQGGQQYVIIDKGV